MSDFILVMDSPGYSHLEHRAHKYTRKEYKNGRWRYFYDTQLTGRSYLRTAAENKATAANYNRYYREQQDRVDHLMNNAKEQPWVKKHWRIFADDEGKTAQSYRDVARKADAQVAKAMRDYRTKSVAGITKETISKAKTLLNNFLEKLKKK